MDPNGTSAWNAVIKGAKKWILFPPNSIPPGVHPSHDGGDVTSPVSLIEWFRGFYQSSLDNSQHNGMLECVCKEGETIFVPSGWYHLVINLEFTIAITQNYVSTSNLLNVISYLSRSPKLISGVPHEKRKYLKVMFLNALKKDNIQAYNIIVSDQEKKKRKRMERDKTIVKSVHWNTLTSSNEPSKVESKDDDNNNNTHTKKKSKTGFTFGFNF